MISLLGGSLGINVTVGRSVSYAAAEKALIDQGFSSYHINRSERGDQTILSLLVFLPTEEITAAGVPEVDAAATLRKMADVVEQLNRL